jgi:GT2 family glycosyltransferase
VQVADAHPVVDVVVQGENIGYGRGMNAAFTHVDETWPTVLVLNPDTRLVTPLSEVLDAAASLGDYGCVGIRQVAPDGSWVPSWDDFPGPMLEWRKALRRPVRSRRPGAGDADRQVDWVMGSFLLLPRSVFAHVGGFDPHYFLFYEEIDLCRRLAVTGRPVWYLAGPVYEHRQDGKHSRWREVARWQGRRIYDQRWQGVLNRFLCRVALSVRWLLDALAPRRVRDRSDAVAHLLATWGLLRAELDENGMPRTTWWRPERSRKVQ